MRELFWAGVAALAMSCGVEHEPLPDPDPTSLPDLGGAGTLDEGDPVVEADVRVVPISTTIHDELGDLIDFSTGVPIHDHAGELVVLGGDGELPTLHKYAYLMDEAAPAFGGELAPNPLVFRFHAESPVGIDPSTWEFGVRTADGTVLRVFAPVATAPAGDELELALHRDGVDGIAALGTYTGELALDVRVFDRDGGMAMTTVRWNHVPLAAPLVFGKGGVSGLAEGLPDNPAALHRLGFDSPDLRKLGRRAFGVEPGVSISDVEVFNPTAESVVLSVSVESPTIHTRRSFRVANAHLADDTTAIDCGKVYPAGPFDPRCNAPHPERAYTPYESPLIDAPASTTKWDARAFRVVDGNLAGSVAFTHDGTETRFVLAPRTRYLITTQAGVLTGIEALAPEDASSADVSSIFEEFEPFHDFALGGGWVVGRERENAGGCVEYKNLPEGHLGCSRVTHIIPYRTLIHAELSLNDKLITRFGTTVSASAPSTRVHSLVVTPDEFGTWSRTATNLPPTDTP